MFNHKVLQVWEFLKYEDSWANGVAWGFILFAALLGLALVAEWVAPTPGSPNFFMP